MKKLLYFMTLAIVAVLSGCDNEFAYPPVSMGEIKGQGTADDPYNVAKAIRVAAANGETSDVFVFTAGYVVSGSIDTSYGNATFDIADTPDGSDSKLILYRIKDFNNKKFTDASKISAGDYIVVYAPLINFRGNTPETGTGGYLYAINGTVGSDIPDTPQGPSQPSTPSGEGTIASPYNVAKAIEVALANGETSDKDVYTEGYVISGSIDTSYGNATWEICDTPDGTSSKITVYRCKDLGNAKFTDADKVKVGDKIVVCAPLINFKGNTPETNLGYLYSINGKTDGTGTTPDTPQGETATFRKASAVTSGKQYLIVAAGKAGTPLASAYGYIQTVDVTINGDEIKADASNAFTFKAAGTAYTITADGKYYYQTGTYNSFNVDATQPTDGATWTVQAVDGKMVITNVSTSKTIQYDPQYKSYGCYPEVKGEYPVLYEKVD